LIGTIASRKYGVAKQANVIAVKVLGSNGSGSMSDVISGVLYASKAASDKAAKAEAEYKKTGKKTHKGSVANMSLGGGKSPALDRAVNRAVDGGLHFAVAAGTRFAQYYPPCVLTSATRQ
jgi:cerevisin